MWTLTLCIISFMHIPNVYGVSFDPIIEYKVQNSYGNILPNTGSRKGGSYNLDLTSAIQNNYASINSNELCFADIVNSAASCIKVPENIDSTAIPNLSFEVYLKQRAYSNHLSWIMSQDDGAYDRSILMEDTRYGSGDKLALGVGGTYTSNINSLPLNTYTHLVAVFQGGQGGKASIYLDGKLKQTTTIQRDSISRFNYFCLNTNPGHNNHGWNGCMKEVRVYECAFNAQQIKSLYQKVVPPPPPRPAIIEYKVENVIGNILPNTGSRTADSYNLDLASAINNNYATIDSVSDELCFADIVDSAASCIKVPENIDSTAIPNLTFEIYVKQRSYSNHLSWIMSQDDGAYDRSIIMEDTRYGYGDKIALGVGGTYTSNINSLSLNVYTHIVAVFEGGQGGKASIYINGVLRQSTTIQRDSISRFNYFCLNTNPAHNNHGWNGCMKRVRVFDRALNPTEIKNLYQDIRSIPTAIIEYEAENTNGNILANTGSRTASSYNLDLTSAINNKYASMDPMGDQCNELCFADIADSAASCIKVPENIDSTAIPNLSFELYIKQRSYHNHLSWIMSQDDGAFDRSILMEDTRYGAGDKLALGVGGTYTSSINSIPLNDYIHLVAVFRGGQGGTASIYIDGQLEQTTTIQRDSISRFNYFCLNTNPGHNNHGFDGCVNEVRVYDYALNIQQIQTLLQESRDKEKYCIGTRSEPIIEYKIENSKGNILPNTGSRTAASYDLDLTSAINNNYASINSYKNEVCFSDIFNSAASCVKVPENIDSTAIPNLSFELYLKQRSYSNHLSWIMSQDDGAYDRSILMEDTRYGGGDKLALGVGGTYTSKINSLPLNTYTHLVAVFEGGQGGKASIYLNGKLKQTTTIQRDSISRFNYFCLNTNPGHNNHGWDGCMKQIRVYERALNSLQIKNLYQKIVPRSPAIIEYKVENVIGNILPNTGSRTADSYNLDLTSAINNNYATINSVSDELCFADIVDSAASCIRVPENIDSTAIPNLTFEVYVKQRSYSNHLSWIMSQDDGAFDRSILMEDTRYGYGDKIALGVGGTYTSNINSLSLNVYTHIVAVFEGGQGGKASIYINGELKQTTTIQRDSISRFNYFCLNTNPGHNNHGWNGCMRRVRVFDRALNPIEIKNLYQDIRSIPTAIIEYEAENRNGNVLMNTGSRTGNNYNLDLTSAINNNFASIGPLGKCNELCFADIVNSAASCVKVPENIDSTAIPNLSFELYIKQRSYSNHLSWIMSQDDGAFDRSILMEDTRYGGGDKLALGVGGTYTSTINSIALNDYVHLVAVFRGGQGGTASIYIDGKLEQTTRIQRDSISRFNYFCLNTNPGHNNHGWNGCVNEVRVYDYALNMQQIQTLLQESRDKEEYCIGSRSGAAVDNSIYYEPEYQPQPQPEQPSTWTIDLASNKWVVAIGFILLIILSLNILFMSYINGCCCQRQKARVYV